MNHFKFHPIGQGLFYTGQLADGKYNFVYDCGTLSGREYLEDAIDKYLTTLKSNTSMKPKIDFVVISHLHADHFNGLESLDDKAEIKRIYLPYLCDDENLIALALANTIFADYNGEDDYKYQALTHMFEFVINLYIESKSDRVTVIGKEQSPPINNYLYTDETLSSQNQYFDWQFTMLNRRLDFDEVKLVKLINDELRRYNVSCIKDLVAQKKIHTISDIYKTVFKNQQNLTSTILLHYPISSCSELLSSSKLNIEHRNNISNNTNITPITLLTGDALMNKEFGERITECYTTKNSDKVGLVQIPHHGSWKNYDLMKKYIDSEIYVASYGLGNGYSHPSRRTIDDLHMNGKELYFANQYEFFDYWIY